MNQDEIIFYADFSPSSSLGSIITKNMMYSSWLQKPISLKGLVCLKPAPNGTIIALYEDLHEKVIPHDDPLKDWLCTVHFVNEILLYLQRTGPGCCRYDTAKHISLITEF